MDPPGTFRTLLVHKDPSEHLWIPQNICGSLKTIFDPSGTLDKFQFIWIHQDPCGPSGFPQLIRIAQDTTSGPLRTLWDPS